MFPLGIGDEYVHLFLRVYIYAGSDSSCHGFLGQFWGSSVSDLARVWYALCFKIGGAWAADCYASLGEWRKAGLSHAVRNLLTADEFSEGGFFFRLMTGMVDVTKCDTKKF